MASPYEVLGVDPDADDEALVRAYRRRVKEAHPDQGGTTDEFRRVVAAYEEILARRSGDGVSPRPGDGSVPGPAAGDRVDSGSERGVAGPGTGARAVDEEPSRPERATVEFLNYELLDDYGWALDDDDLFEKAADADLDHTDYGHFLAERGKTLLEAAEERGYVWPYSCRGGACANCAVAIVGGELSMPVDHILTDELLDRGIRLSCVGAPITGDLQVVYNVKHLPDVEELLLPPGPFKGKADD